MALAAVRGDRARWRVSSGFIRTRSPIGRPRVRPAGRRACPRESGGRCSVPADRPIEGRKTIFGTKARQMSRAERRARVERVVVMDWVSRAVLAWRLSNTLGAEFCVEAREAALARYGQPEIFNTDQGSRFTSDAFTAPLKRPLIAISMDGKSLPSRKRGRCMHNVFVERLWRSRKYQEVYLNAYASVAEAKAGMPPGSASTTSSGSTRAGVAARRGKSTRKAGGYGDDRRRRPAALPPLPEPARKAGKCSPFAPYPQAPQPTQDLILMRGK